MRQTFALAVLVLGMPVPHLPALAAEPAPGPLVTRDYLIASRDPGILISVRFKGASRTTSFGTVPTTSS